MTTQMKAQLPLFLTIHPTPKNRYRNRSRKPLTPLARRPLSMLKRPRYDQSPIDNPPAVVECWLQITRKFNKNNYCQIGTFQLSPHCYEKIIRLNHTSDWNSHHPVAGRNGNLQAGRAAAATANVWTRLLRRDRRGGQCLSRPRRRPERLMVTTALTTQPIGILMPL